MTDIYQKRDKLFCGYKYQVAKPSQK